MNENFSNTSIAKSDKKGYDLEADGAFFEVKTSKAQNATFFISANELMKANKFQDSYNIFYVEVDENKRTAVGYIIQNPLSAFKVDYLSLFKEIISSEANLTPDKYKVEISKHLKKGKRIDLTKIYQAIIKSASARVNL